MYVLVINAFGKNESKFEEFLKIIKQTLRFLCPSNGLDKINFLIENCENLKNYLYENDDGSKLKLTEINEKNKLNFLNLDFIFIDGTEKYLPWKKESQQLVKLVKLCIINNKNIFAAGVGSCILTYLMAVSLNSEINIVSHKCKTIHELVQYKGGLDCQDWKKHDYFLDHSSGDIYDNNIFRTNFSLDKLKYVEWQPVMNVGIHNVIAAEDHQKHQNSTIYINPFRVSNEKINLITSTCKELKTFVPNILYSHYLFHDIPQNFVVYSTNKWMPHKFYISDLTYYYTFLAESKKGPLIIERANSLGCFFHLKSKYENSIKILENYIKHQMQNIKLEGYAIDKLITQLNTKRMEQEKSNLTTKEYVDQNAVDFFLNKTKREIESNLEFIKECNNKLKEDSSQLRNIKITSEDKNKDRYSSNKESLIFHNNSIGVKNFITSNDFYKNETSGSINLKLCEKNHKQCEIKNNFNRLKSAVPSQLQNKTDSPNTSSRNMLEKYYSPIKNDVNVFAVMFPYVREEEFPKPVKKHIVGSGLHRNKAGTDVIRLELYKKQESNYERLFKQYENELRTSNCRVSKK